MACDQSEKVQNDKACGSNMAFHREREEKKRKHIEKQVSDVGMNEAAHDHRVVLPLTQKEIRSKQELVDDIRQAEHAEQADKDSQAHDGWGGYLSGFKHASSLSSMRKMPVHWHHIAPRILCANQQLRKREFNENDGPANSGCHCATGVFC